MEDRHWDEIFEILGERLDLNNEYFTLNSLIEHNVKKDKDKIGEIAMKADKEKELEQIFEKVTTDWKKAEFTVK